VSLKKPRSTSIGSLQVNQNERTDTLTKKKSINTNINLPSIEIDQKVKNSSNLKISQDKNSSNSSNYPCFEQKKEEQKIINQINLYTPKNNSYTKRSLETRNSVSSCPNCKNYSNKMLRLPTCQQHYYCETCINKRSFKKECLECKAYLDSFSFKTKNDRNFCCLCKKNPNFASKCADHRYCRTCWDFISNNNYDHLELIRSCTSCRRQIKEKNKVETPRMPSERNPTTSIEKFIPFSNSTDQDFNPNSAREKLCAVKSSSFSNKNNIHVLRTDMKTVTKPKKINQKLTIDSYRNIFDSIKCSICFDGKDILGFTCNHNLCSYCLVGGCCNNILNFFTQYQINQSYVKNRFSYRCPVSECNQSISVPTVMVITKLLGFLNDPQSRVKFEKFSFFCESNHINMWIPYLDGLMIYDL
jgi:hypothetical protein